MKYDWKKQDKQYYLPKNKPELINLPALNFFTIKGKGNPNKSSFGDYIAALYSLSYAIKMSPKSGLTPESYYEYSVFPLEGIWDISDEAKQRDDGSWDKNDLVFNLMIRQPDFVTYEYALETIDRVKLKKPQTLLDIVKFEAIEEGKCIQMLHIGSFDNEPESFNKMERYAVENGLTRKCKIHREIYLSDARKTVPEKLKTVLRFTVE